MKKVLFIIITVIAVVFFNGCTDYAKHDKYELIEVNSFNNEYELHMNGKVYTTINDAKWHPEETYYDEICGICDYNGITLIHPTSSPICYYIKNSANTQKPVVWLFEKCSGEAWYLLTKNPTADMVDEIYFENMLPKNDTTETIDTINDAELIKRIFGLINNQEEYVEIEADKALDSNGNWNGGYVYGDITKADGCTVNKAGTLKCYSEQLKGMYLNIMILEYQSDFYYVISLDGGNYTCVKDQNTIDKSITEQLNNLPG